MVKNYKKSVTSSLNWTKWLKSISNYLKQATIVARNQQSSNKTFPVPFPSSYAPARLFTLMV